MLRHFLHYAITPYCEVVVLASYLDSIASVSDTEQVYMYISLLKVVNVVFLSHAQGVIPLGECHFKPCREPQQPFCILLESPEVDVSTFFFCSYGF